MQAAEQIILALFDDAISGSRGQRAGLGGAEQRERRVAIVPPVLIDCAPMAARDLDSLTITPRQSCMNFLVPSRFRSEIASPEN